jgi:hypothetical protein
MSSCAPRRGLGPRRRPSQGLPAKVADHDVLREVATLLGLKGSVAPDGGQARGVEAVEAPATGSDDDVLE